MGKNRLLIGRQCHNRHVLILAISVVLSLFSVAQAAFAKMIFTERGIEMTSEPTGARIAIFVTGHSCSERPQAQAQTPTFEWVTPYINPQDQFFRFEGSKKNPKRCATYRFVVSRLGFETIEESVDGRILEKVLKHWALVPIAQAGTSAPNVRVAIEAELDGDVISGSHFRYQEIQWSVLDLLDELVNRKIISGYELGSSSASSPGADHLSFSFRFTEKEDRHLGKAFAKGFAVGALTLGAGAPKNGSYDFTSTVKLEIARNETVLGSQSASSEVKEKVNLGEYNKEATAIRKNLTRTNSETLLTQLATASGIQAAKP